MQTPKQQFYLTKLLGFQYEIVYRSGKSNKVADALSRQENFISGLNTHFIIKNPIMVAIRRGNEELEEMKDWHNLYEQHQLPSNFIVREGILFFQNRIVVPNLQQLKGPFFHAYHNVPTAGQGGSMKTYKAIAEVFFWRNMRKEVIEFIKGCQVYQKVKYSIKRKSGLLQLLPIPDKPWTDIIMDFIIGLPNTKGYVVLLVVVDRFIKCAHFNPLRPFYTASSVAEIFI